MIKQITKLKQRVNCVHAKGTLLFLQHDSYKSYTTECASAKIKINHI